MWEWVCFPVLGVSASVNQQTLLGSDTWWLTAWLQWKQGSSVCKEEENQRISWGWTAECVCVRACWPVCVCVHVIVSLRVYLCLWLMSPAGWKAQITWHWSAPKLLTCDRLELEVIDATPESTVYLNFNRYLCSSLPRLIIVKGARWVGGGY